MTTQRTLASLKEALQQPFAPETIQFLPKDIHQENGKTVCLALPYANKRVYEDRLNELVYGEWSSPYTPPYAQGNKLIIPATVVILGVAHTDYGEAFMTTPGKNGTPREDENTATEAYSQAFRRACVKFLLGRYLYDLPKHKLPYDPKTRQIAISKAERIAWVEKLYMEHGLALRSSFTAQRSVVVQTTATVQGMAPLVTTATSTVQQNGTATAVQKQVSTPQTKTASAPQQEALPADHGSQSAPQQPTVYQDTFLDWVAQQVGRDPERVQGICTFYQVQGLAKLSGKQRKELTKRLRQQASHQRQAASAATASV